MMCFTHTSTANTLRRIHLMLLSRILHCIQSETSERNCELTSGPQRLTGPMFVQLTEELSLKRCSSYHSFEDSSYVVAHTESFYLILQGGFCVDTMLLEPYAVEGTYHQQTEKHTKARKTVTIEESGGSSA